MVHRLVLILASLVVLGIATVTSVTAADYPPGYTCVGTLWEQEARIRFDYVSRFGPQAYWVFAWEANQKYCVTPTPQPVQQTSVKAQTAQPTEPAKAEEAPSDVLQPQPTPVPNWELPSTPVGLVDLILGNPVKFVTLTDADGAVSCGSLSGGPRNFSWNTEGCPATGTAWFRAKGQDYWWTQYASIPTESRTEPTITFGADKTHVCKAEAVKLFWNTTGSTVKLNGQGVKPIDSFVVKPTSNQLYELTVDGYKHTVMVAVNPFCSA